jgi:hypothetical protein
MESFYSERVFTEESIDLFADRVGQWMSDERVFYYGSFLFDINGNRYYRKQLESNWMIDNDLLTPEEQILVERLKKNLDFNSFEGKLSITLIIQLQYLSQKNKILHLFVDPVDPNKTGSCEFISLDTDEKLHVSLDRLTTVIGDVKEEIKNDIIESFKFNFSLIRPYGFHMYFFPTALPLLSGKVKIVNVTTVICPELKKEDWTHIQGGIQYSIEGLLKDTIKFLYRKERKEAVKSAKAAIMSRNLSHNLGSHVMSYLKQSLGSVTDMEYSGALVDAFGKGEEIKKELPFLVGTGRFISYLQERQDFIATVATDYIPFPSVVNFKDAIYDELNPDYRFLRHSEWKGHKPVNILLENIAKSEGLSRSIGDTEQRNNNIIIKFREFDGLHITDVSKSSYEDLRRWNFSLPGGVMGRQAVFSIVENAIRNSAKHGARENGENLVFVFDIIDPLEPLDDKFFQDYQSSKDRFDCYIVTLTDSIKTDSKDVSFINEILKNPFDKDANDLTASNKGLKEMLISAAWLRGIRIEDYQAESSEIAPILRARNTPEGYLQYVFCLPKVKEVALITEDKLADKKEFDLWAKNGWYVYSVDEYKRLSGKNFSFVILDKDLSEKKEEIRRISNNRFFVSASNKDFSKREIIFDFEKCSGLIETDDFKAALGDLYEQLASFDDEPVRITIIDEKTDSAAGEISSFLSLGEDESNIQNARYLYRKHNDTDKEFVDLLHTLKIQEGNLASALDSLQFIEGITGGNSTDRLIRREFKDDLWVYQHAHAMKTRIAVFDERIFTKITGYEMSQLVEENREAIDWVKELEGLEDMQAKMVVNRYDFTRNKALSYSSLMKYSRQELIDFAKDTYPLSDPVIVCELNRIIPLVYHKKGIDVYTWTKTNDSDTEKRFAIWGVRLDIGSIETDTMKDEWRKNIYGRIDKVADLVIKGGKPKIQIDRSLPAYDYVSVHQGLLDKLYESAFRGCPSDANDASDSKLLFTKEIHSKFVCVSSDQKDYLPGLAIHSGRSKPNSEDMPQHQPFIQYAAIENAISDCKFTLVNLFDFACYEK